MILKFAETQEWRRRKRRNPDIHQDEALGVPAEHCHHLPVGRSSTEIEPREAAPPEDKGVQSSEPWERRISSTEDSGESSEDSSSNTSVTSYETSVTSARDSHHQTKAIKRYKSGINAKPSSKVIQELTYPHLPSVREVDMWHQKLHLTN